MEDWESILRRLIKSVVREVADEVLREYQLTESKHSWRDAETEERLLLTPREAAKRLAISDRHLFRLTSEGIIPFVKVGQSKRYSVEAIENWIREAETVGQSNNGPRKSRAKTTEPLPATNAKPKETAKTRSTRKTGRIQGKQLQNKAVKSPSNGNNEERISPFRLLLDEIGIDRNEFSEITNGEIRQIAGVDIPTMHGWLYLGRDLPEEALEKLRSHFIARQSSHS